MTPLPPAFARLAWSNLLAQLSEQVALAAAPLVAVLLLQATASQTGLLQTAQTLPYLLLAIPAGLLADRVSRRGLMAVAEAVRAASLLCTLLLLLSGALSLALLAALGFSGAVATVCYSVAAPALVPGMVTRAQLSAANRWLELARSMAFMAGPAAGGAVVGWMGGPAAYVLATVLSLVAVVLLSGLPAPAATATIRRHVVQDLREGAVFVLTHAYLRPILLTAIIFNASWFILQAVYVAYAVHHLGLTAMQTGVTLGVYGFGMVAGAVVVPGLARYLPMGGMIAFGPLCAFAASLIMLATLREPSVALAGLSLFLFGAGPIIWTITTTTLRQSVTPNALLGRATALIVTATFGARPAGAGIAAILAAQFGVEACFAASAAGFAIQFLVLFTSPVRRLTALPDPVSAWAASAPSSSTPG